MSTAPRWRKSRHSGANTNCVEIDSTLTAIRDTKNPAAVLRFSDATMSRFLTRVARQS
ncbi:hypothetical protein GCM10022243_46040 [Saccharothrix violaceirubra]|uniref:DUF397 domain-containing protein n=1 Tax=Saccharothrix violaceirubra TaxID=413306 RepID=A0A7W7T0U9_9PSEU|nr:DUF397 domain-containing protein [Saccharothrix violaceirubra]MBB4964506.1 hypothetical protein [Saccharothrix violaceirubra]